MSAPEELDKPLREGEKANDDANDAAHHGGNADQDARNAAKDAQDEDQSSQDKARNTTDDAADGLGEVGKGLDALGLHGLGDKVTGLADDLHSLSDKLFGQRADPKKGLPPVAYRIWFGGQSMKDGLLGDLEEAGEAAGDQVANLIGDSVLSAIPVVGGALGGLAHNAVSSFLHKPGADDEPTGWKIAQIQHTEAISELFRCEMILWREEFVSDKEKTTPSKGGILSAINDMASMVSNTVKSVENTVSSAIHDPLGTAKSLLGGALGGSSGPPPEGEQPFINMPLDPANWLNQPVTVSITREFDDDDTQKNEPDMYKYPFTKRYVTGVVAEFEDLGRRRQIPQATHDAVLGFKPDAMGVLQATGINQLFPGGAIGQLPPGSGAYRFVRVVVMPSLWKLSLRKNCRIFQNMTALEITRQVIRDAGIYGSLPNVGGASSALGGLVGDAMSAVAGVAESIPLVGDALGNAIQGQHISAIPPAGKHEKNWTAKREYCVQYNETDLDFVRRLLEEEGVSYYFIHKKRKEELRLIDDPRDQDKIPTIDGRAAPYSRASEMAKPHAQEYVYNITNQRKMGPKRVTLRDWNHSDNPQQATVMAAGARPDKGPDYEDYRYPAHATFQYEEGSQIHYKRFRDGEEGNRAVAKLRLQSILAQQETGRGTSIITGMVAGGTLHLKGHREYRHYKDSDKDKSEKLLITRVRHIGYSGLGLTGTYESHDYMPSAIFGNLDPQHKQDIVGEGQIQQFDYYNQFEYSFIDEKHTDATRWRPPITTPRPVIQGVQTATVVDTHNDPWGQDENIHIDDRTSGRVLVRFHWDQRGEEALSISKGKSCWVRVAQNWAGEDFGTVWVPRVGSEVVVSFLDGDPDRPLIIGSVHNALNLPPVTLRENAPKQEKDLRTQSILRTRTNPGQDTGKINEVMFEDADKKEEIRFTAQRYLLEEVRRHHVTTVMDTQENTVAGSQGEVVDGKQTMTVTKDRTKTVKKDEVVRIGKHRWETVEGNEDITIRGDRDEKVHGLEDVTIGDEKSREQLDPLVRQLTVFGTRDTHILSPESEPEPGKPEEEWTKVTDLIEVHGSKTDEILGPLTVKAGSFGIGQQPKPGQEGNSDGLEFEKDTLRIHAEKNFEVHADGQIKILTDNNEIEIAANDPPVAAGSTTDEPRLVLRCGPEGDPDAINYVRAYDNAVDGHTVEIMGHKSAHVQITVGENTLLNFFGENQPTDSGIDMKVRGSPVVWVWFEPNRLKFDGGSFFAWMSMNIDLDGKGGVMFASGT